MRQAWPLPDGHRAAATCGITTDGWTPKGFLTEEGPRPEFAGLYHAREMPTDFYRARTEQNVRDCHALLWFGSTDTPGANATLLACDGMGRPRLLIFPNRKIRPSDSPNRLKRQPQVKVLNIAGNRESKSPGVGKRVERFLLELFRQLSHQAG